MKRPVVIILLIVALALVCAGIGAVAFFAARDTGTSFGMGNLSSATQEESKTLKVNAEKPVTLEVTDDAGNVTVVGADVDAVEIRIVKTSHAPSQTRADEELKNIKYDIKQAANRVTITYEVPNISSNMPNVNVISPNWETVDFVITVPSNTTVDIDNGMGRTNVSGLQGQVTINNDFGDVTVEQVDGELEIKSNSGRIDAISVKAGSADIDLYTGFGTIHLDQVSGAGIKVQSSSGALNLENVRASQEMELSSDFGSITFDNGSAGSLTVATKSGAIELTSVNVSGALTASDDFGDIDLEKVKAKSYDAQTDSGSITIDGAQAKIKAHTGFGNITIRNAQNAVLDLNTQSGTIKFEGSVGEGANSVHSDFGAIELSIPPDSALNVDFATEFGSIRSDLPIMVVLTGKVDPSHQTGSINGGGSDFQISTKSGDITVTILGQ